MGGIIGGVVRCGAGWQHAAASSILIVGCARQLMNSREKGLKSFSDGRKKLLLLKQSKMFGQQKTRSKAGFLQRTGCLGLHHFLSPSAAGAA
ncbi:MAG: hypothetical protein KBF22_12390, partial [Ottowia sp.]|nr:hypothetical protein [Ottowia sp.]